MQRKWANRFEAELRQPYLLPQGHGGLYDTAELARRYLASIKAPRKESVAIRDGGHFAVSMNSVQFLKVLVKRFGR